MNPFMISVEEQVLCGRLKMTHNCLQSGRTHEQTRVFYRKHNAFIKILTRDCGILVR